MEITRRDLLRLAGAGSLGFAVPTILGCEPHSPITAAAADSPGPLLAAAAPALKLIDALVIRRAQDRGHADHGWLKAAHSFSFSRYQDPAHMGFRSLRVLNEDVIQPTGGFPMHPHRDMEIITYILDGALEHKDSMGNGSVIRPGEVQHMTAGTGVRHSEFNPSGSAAVHLIQIWLLPDRRHHTPRYAQRPIPRATREQPVRLIASPDGAQGSVPIHQDARIHAVNLQAHQQLHFDVRPQRHAWVQVARGELIVNGQTLHPGDGLSTSQDGALLFSATSPAELLIFDLA